MQKRAIITLIMMIAAPALFGCGGREAHPVNAININDNSLDCASIERELIANNDAVRTTMKEKSNGQLKNAALGVGGLILWPAWFFMDPKSPEKKEIDAYQSRNKVLTSLAKQKKCRIAVQ